MGAILDGKALSEQIQAQVALEVANLKKCGIFPKLCVILVGDNPASISYVNMKKKACERTGIESLMLKFDENISQETLLDEIARLNADKSVSGILVQLPLPKHIDTSAILEAIEVYKDVDGFHPYNVGRLFSNIPCNDGNLSLDKHSADLANFECSQTPSLVSHSKFAKNYESRPENPSVVLNGKSKNDSSLLGESSVNSSSLRENERSEFSWQSAGFPKETSALPCFANEVKQPSKSSDFKKQGESMIEKQINTDSLQVRDLQKAQSLPDRLPRESCGFSRNDDRNSPSLAEGVRGWVDLPCESW